AMLMDEGLFSLNDPVNDYLPFEVVHPGYPDTDMTFKMILTHTSAIKDNWGAMPYYPGDSPLLLGDYLEDYLTPAGAYYHPTKNFHTWEPGTSESYSNIAVALAGYLVEMISGTPLEDFCQDRLFGPLDMNETSYFLANLDPDHIAMPFAWNGSYTAYGHFGYSDYPSGQVRTSAPQLLRFLTVFMHGRFEPEPPCHLSESTILGGGGFGLDPFGGAALKQAQGSVSNTVRLLSPQTVELMLTPQNPGINPDQGLIWYQWNLNGRSLWGHNGGDAGVSTEMWYHLEKETGVVCLTNGEAYFNEIIEALLQYAERY
ncbi:MAG: beta-lactamase family protein, partial [Planctomycetes bacterium]|nr:beta-lactamase family protein [Planctomycetota bacterium]